ncbi:hypothetical protein DRZ77_00075 [Candidatus Woesearchaeota archaeon]|nr:DUF86 domain-containing protein [Candidatus Woesearchaeota archaeon]RLE41132.1 MAG: hypothetical protein DRZ77_00075 [Candidatus Woesearchaeota archaeon]
MNRKNIRLIELFNRIEEHVSQAKELFSKDYKEDRIIFNALCMECFQAINSAIDLGEEILSIANIGIPITYRDIFNKLCDAGWISKEITKCISTLIYYRNVISHEYHKITFEELKDVVDKLDCLIDFLARIKKKLEKIKD